MSSAAQRCAQALLPCASPSWLPIDPSPNPQPHPFSSSHPALLLVCSPLLRVPFWVRSELGEAKAATRAAEQELRNKGSELEEAVSRVRSELLSNAEQVGHELRQRVKEIQSVEQQERTDANAAVEASNALAERLGELSNELRTAEAQMQEEAAERRSAEAEAHAQREEMKQALVAAQEAAAAEAAEEMNALKSELEVRRRAEEALQVMLAAAHEQQGQLEDVGNQHQAATAETFEDLRAALGTTSERLQAEERAREAGVQEAQRMVRNEATERERRLGEVGEASKALNAATEQVLRTEIRARMKGEEKLSLDVKQAGERAHVATLKVADALESHRKQSDVQIRTLSDDLGRHKGHIEAELALASGRVEAVSGQHASSLASLHKDHQILTKATRGAVQTLKDRFTTSLEELEGRGKAATEALRVSLTGLIEERADEAHSRIDECETTLVSKLEDVTQALAEERSERIASMAELRSHLERSLKAMAEEMRAADAAANARIDTALERIDATDARLQATAEELRQADARLGDELAEATHDLQGQLDAHSGELEAVGAQLEAQEELLLGERSARMEAVRNCAEAAAEALQQVAEEAHAEAVGVATDLQRVDEAQKAALNDLRFKIDHNFKAIEQTLDEYQVGGATGPKTHNTGWGWCSLRASCATTPTKPAAFVSLAGCITLPIPSPFPPHTPSLSLVITGARVGAAALPRVQLGAPAAARAGRARRQLGAPA